MLKEWCLEYIFEYKIRIIYKALKMFKINKIEWGILFIRLKFDSVCQHLLKKYTIKLNKSRNLKLEKSESYQILSTSPLTNIHGIIQSKGKPYN